MTRSSDMQGEGEKVVVTQADRRAAADLISTAPLVENPDIIRHKGADDGGFVQSFARHRQASTAELVEALEGAVGSLEWWKRNQPGTFGNIEGIALENARTALSRALGEREQ